ncbi:MAG TPA: DNA repair protein RecN [Rhizomicrobium sp.]|jgi:DNA repair protein RecN (Recombination protein N)|nr:DNA repair protein RecN [Rhizomicrobium sp.]
MLATLKVRDLVLIEDVELEFVPGLNVLTGETGAGKSILLDALGLAAGGRAGARSSVRPGAQQGSASAIFDLPRKHAARSLIVENGIPSESEVLLRRTIAVDGRTRGFVNDEAVGVGLLREIGALLVEIHGQADERGLFDASTHRKLLDAFGKNEVAAAKTAELFAEYVRLRDHAASLRAIAETAAANTAHLRHTVDDLEALAPEAGEEERLASERALLMNASRISEEISAAVDLLGSDRGAESVLGAALKRLSRLQEEARQPSAERALEQAFAFTEEARRELEALLSRLDVDPGELEKKEERLFALRAAARKHGVPADELPGVLARAQQKLDALGNSDLALKETDAKVGAAHASFLNAAGRLSILRRKAAQELESAVTGELAPLKLDHAKFRVLLEPIAKEDAGSNGLERVAFEVATVADAPFGSLTKIASGGELARFSLALKVALSEASPPAALVFDEVDRGVGGAVADAVGERLQRLARTTQVLLVTHAPQVAARAEHHFRIARVGDRTEVQLLSAEERIEELARMLSGAAVTEEARAAARRLLAEARTPPGVRKRA